MKISICLFLLTLFLTTAIDAQIDINKDDLYKKYSSSNNVENSVSGIHSPLIDSMQIALAVENAKAQIEYNRRLIADYHHSQEVFDWQLTSSYIIFWLVILLVLSGIVLSWLQFLKPDQKLTDASGNPISSVLKFSFKSGIEITSPVLGVLILVISMVFFYFYLVEVYQIRIVK
jgi:hypothetical protein